MTNPHIREIILSAHNHGMLAMLEHGLRGYLKTTRDTNRGPVQRKMLEDALALVSAVLDEIEDDHDMAIEEAGV